MKYVYLSTNGVIKATYNNVSHLRTDEGLVKVKRAADVTEPEFKTFDPYVLVAVIRLGEGERLVIA